MAFSEKMQTKLLKSIVADIAGKQAVEIVDLLVGKKDVNEFMIAKKLNLTINQTRNILYKLSDAGLVSFTRKKDKRKGWYIYFWTLNSLKSLVLLENNFLHEIREFENQLKSRKTKRFYFCKTCNVEVGEESALLSDFTCQECGEVYSLAENERVIKELVNHISKIKKSLDVVRGEKNKESEKQDKKKSRKYKREEKVRKKEASIKRKKRAKERDKDKKKLEKEKLKKKPEKVKKKSKKKKIKKSKSKKKVKKKKGKKRK